MKHLFFTLAMVFSLVFVKAQVPDLEVQDINKNWISLNDLVGEQYTVIDFWATWCKPCVAAIPKLNSIYNEVSDDGINFIGINVDGPRNQSKVKPFAIAHDIKYSLVLDPDQQLVNEFNITVFPTLIVLNEKGDEVFIHEGFNAGDEILIKKELLKLIKK